MIGFDPDQCCIAHTSASLRFAKRGLAMDRIDNIVYPDLGSHPVSGSAGAAVPVRRLLCAI
jgi:hypothetical protein